MRSFIRGLLTTLAALQVLAGTGLRAQVIGSDLMVANDNNAGTNPSFIQRYSGANGQYLGNFTLGSFPNGQITVVYGPNGNLYVGSQSVGQISQFSGTSGTFVSTTVPNNVASASKYAFGPDGNLYYFRDQVGGSASIERVNPTTGNTLGTFVPAGSGGLQTGIASLAFGPDGNLYAGFNNRVLRYNGTTGALLGTFITPGSGGLINPADMLFLADGSLLVSSVSGANAVLRYDGTTGAFLGTFASGNGLAGPWGMALGPDGRLYVASTNSNKILRFNGTTGTFVDTFVNSTANPFPTYIAFTPTPIPEPTTLGLVGCAAAGLTLTRALRLGLPTTAMRPATLTPNFHHIHPDRL